jgi:hypothetical protein
MDFCQDPSIKLTPLYIPCLLLDNRRKIHAFNVFIVGVIILIIYSYIYSKIPISGISMVLISTFLTYQYDLITKLMLYYA